MKDLVFIGGAKGVGKTTIVSKLSKLMGIPMVNTGEIVLRARNIGLDPELEIEKYLCGQFRGIVDTHYTGGYFGEKFSRGLSKMSLLSIGRVKSVDLVLLEVNDDVLFQRRLDCRSPKYQDKQVMHLELECNRAYFHEYCKDLLTCGRIINNVDLNDTVLNLIDFVK
jgi:adenylate kinase